MLQDNEIAEFLAEAHLDDDPAVFTDHFLTTYLQFVTSLKFEKPPKG
ncbi:hypothetical protein [Endozoicomonas sp. ALD040]